MGIKIIAGVSHNGVIGKDGDLVLRHKEDLQRFKALTTGSTVIMGRKTWDSLGNKLLRDSGNIVLSRRKVSADEIFDSMIKDVPLTMTLTSLVDKIKTWVQIGIDNPHLNHDYWIIGGGEIYKQLMSITDELHITRWNKVVEGDTFFSEIDLNVWELVGLEEAKTTDEFVFETWRRKGVEDG